MAKHGDRTGSANTHTREVDFCASVQEKSGAIIHMSTSHESANEEKCDARAVLPNRSKCNRMAELDEFRRFESWSLERTGSEGNRERSPGATVRRSEGIVSKMNSIPIAGSRRRSTPRDANDIRRNESRGSLELASYGFNRETRW